jgi:hydroxymethylbilane synthase
LIRIGSRGSKLALWQANYVADALRGRGCDVEIVIIRTRGDQIQDRPLPSVGGKGLFTAEIEIALENTQVDLAVHSLKDLPTEIAPQFVLAAIPEREDPRDVLLALAPVTVGGLPNGAMIGTSSPRRQGQLLALRQDLHVQSLRGNVDTRIRKLEQGEADAIVLAAAGVNRLGLAELVREHIDPEHLCPCPGQGALAIECRRDDSATHEALAFLDNAPTRRAVEIERGVLAQLGGGCSIPVGVYCAPHGDGHRVWAAVCSADGRSIVRVEHSGRESSEDLIDMIAGKLRSEGAEAILNVGHDGRG